MRGREKGRGRETGRGREGSGCEKERERQQHWSISSGWVPKSCVTDIPCAGRQTRVSLPGGTGFKGMKGSWGIVEISHCVVGLESLKRVQERLQQKHFGDSSTMDVHKEQQQQWSGVSRSLGNRVCCRGQNWRGARALWRSPEDSEWVQDRRHWDSTLWVSGFALFRLWLCHDYSFLE